jgi:ketosteroid isomerase-like protein
MSCSTTSYEKEAILNVMNQQEKDWNDGRIDNFMIGYWQSDSLMFVGKNGMNYGWKKTLNNYKKSYPDKSSMGKLKFDVLKLELNGNTAFMLGKWNLAREKDNPNGYFTLYWKKIDGNWLITIDHSS